MTFWKRLADFPPVLVRLLAKRGPYGLPMSNAEIAAASGLTEYQVASLSGMTTWDTVEMQDVRRFCQACGIDLANYPDVKRVQVYIRGRKHGGHTIPPSFRYLRKSPQWETLFKPLAAIYFKSWQEKQAHA